MLISCRTPGWEWNPTAVPLDLIHKNLGYWVAIHLDYVAPVDLQQEDDLRSLYDALGAPPSLATYLASDLQIRWDEERRRMVVSNVHERNPPISQIIDALMAFWNF